MAERIQCDRVILGAGVIGLAVAARVGDGQTILVEAHDGFGRETSSRNSEVIHSGIHYPLDSWKTRLCLEGQNQLYEFCDRHQVPYRRCGKLILASEGEGDRLETIAAHAQTLGVKFERWSAARVAEAEPLLAPMGGLLFPRTGIIDSHSFMAALEAIARQRETSLVYRHRVTGISRAAGEWILSVDSPDGEIEIQAPVVVNAAGLAAASLSNQALGGTRYEHRYCRGRYFNLSGKYRHRFEKLVYPVPQKDGLGVHTTFDLEGYARLGPDVDWSPTLHYDCDWEKLRDPFATSARRLVPGVARDELQPGTIGIRPKLFQNGAATPDFLIEANQGWVHCLGIESPGLTSALAIADRVGDLVD